MPMNERRANFLLGQINQRLDAKTQEETAVREQEARERDAYAQRELRQKNAVELALSAKRGGQTLAAERAESRDRNIAARMMEQQRLMAASARPERKNDELERQQIHSRQRYMERQNLRQRAYS